MSDLHLLTLTLAKRTHWGEAEILGLPLRRIIKYLQRFQEQSKP